MFKRSVLAGARHPTSFTTAALLLYVLSISIYFPITAARSNGGSDHPDQIPLAPLPPLNPSDPVQQPVPSSKEHHFTLRHIFHHGVYEYPKLHKRLDVEPNNPLRSAVEGQHGEEDGPFRARSQAVPIQRLSDRRMLVVQNLINTARLSGLPPDLSPSAWSLDEVLAPDVTDKETVISLALMAANAYVEEPGTGEWEDVNGGFNYSDSFGWEGDGLRGHIFADEGNKTIVIALKGTTPAVFDGAGSTTKDKINDNLFFSCCCAQGGHFLWKKVCDCSSSAFTCNQTCLVRALHRENRYYRSAMELYGNVTELYPNSHVWLSGHSLGGSVSSMLGLTFGLPVTTFEAPGEALAAARLGLPAPPGSRPDAPQSRSNTAIYHFGHTADPIFMGSCNAATSGCTLGGYAMETQCHTGQVCTYDTVKDKNWRVSISYHKIRGVIADVYRNYDGLPKCAADSECVDCFNWKYFESNGSETTTTGSGAASTTSQTRTSTCKTPGWWGCRDETTTAEVTSTSTTTVTETTVTCKSYGWFGGCLDSSTTTITSTIRETTAIPLPTSTDASTTPTSNTTEPTCKHYGWFGQCKDPKPAINGCQATASATSSPKI
ncbi:MAG: hypothetical protein LQ342_002376 [Letrouitia transgressa]|nr:MAG: hypothetical protein LQ342_002376 [Letrouitia transgressa]